MSEKLATTFDIADAPDDGYERWLIRGQMRTSLEKFHVSGQSAMIADVCGVLGEWVDKHRACGLDVYTMCHCRVEQNPETTLIAHVALTRPDSWLSLRRHVVEFIDEFPSLLVHVIDCRESPETLQEKEQIYSTSSGIVWVIDPYRLEIKVIERGESRTIQAIDDRPLHDGSIVQGLAINSADLFEDFVEPDAITCPVKQQ
jgi:Uma2 family endonuclease